MSADTNWTDSANWLPAAVPNANTNVLFIDRGATTGPGIYDNVVNTSQTILQLAYEQTNGVHNTLILPGVTLTISNSATATNLLVGTLTTGNVTTLMTTNTISGPGGTLAITSTNTGSVFTVRQTTGGSAGSHLAVLDMSGLDNFNTSVGSLWIGVFAGTAVTRPQGALYLAKTNQLTFLNAGTQANPAIDMGDTGSSPNVGNILALGITNSILADTFQVGNDRGGATLKFNATFTNSTRPYLFLRGHANTRVTIMNIGDDSAAGGVGSSASGLADFSGGTLDAMIGSMTLGNGQTAVGAGTATGTLTMSAGTLNVNTLQIGYEGVNGAVGVSTGTVNINGGTLTVNTSLNLARSLGGTVPVGTLNINNATVNGTGSIVAGGGTSTINLTASTLAISNTIGAAAAPLTSFDATNSTINFTVSLNTSNLVATTLNLGGGNTTLNISSLPSIAGYPAQFPLVVYGSSPGESTFALGTLPGTYTGYISNDPVNLTYWLVVSNGPTPAKNVSWNGNHNGNWDTTTQNWLTSGSPSSYSQGDFVTLDDTLTGTTNVVLTTTLLPGSLTVNNSGENYVFSGTGKISGNVSLVKQGSDTLVLDNANTNDFSGALAVTAGTVQLGNNDANGNLAQTITVNNNSTLVFDQSSPVTFPNTINGAGSVTQIGANILALGGGSGYAGGLNANAGVIRLSGTAQGSGTVTVNSSGTLVTGAALTNTVSLAGGTLGTSLSVTHSGDVTAQPSTTTTVLTADPQNLGVILGYDTILTGTLHGSGNINVMTGSNTPNPDGGNGFRLRGTLTSDFSGVITLENSVKGELQTTISGSFTPAGSGSFVLTGGTYAADGTTNGTYCELNLRNNSSGTTTFGNNITIAGTGLAVVNPLGTAPAASWVNMGNLTMGSGQELGVHLNNGNAHVVVFNSVTLTGGNATFAPKVPGLGTNGVGSDLALANISESTPGSGIIMNGLRTLTIFGNNTYSGNTTINSGTLALSGGSTTLGNSPLVSMAAGSTLDVSANGGTYNLATSQTLAGAGTLNGNLVVGSGTTLAPSATNGVFLVTNGTATLQGNTIMCLNRSGSTQTNSILDASSISFSGTLTVSNLGPAVVAGDTYQLFIANNYSGVFTATNLPALPPGYSWNNTNLATGTLSVIGPSAPVISSVVASGGSLIISGTGSSPSGNYAVCSTTNLLGTWTPIVTNPFVSGTFSYTNTINPATPQRFFRILAQ